ncbi:hypothetical protein EYC84_003698 [Monilinia fructicola]|uniref:Uncharacterized protein n=1 Tax=Monilinia fructicola TaxID=38448 RepID=A0A5M9JX24_MONFR|nr:hypothetical protein EYC84_003698 [Monilinia fructicola]
MQPQGTVHAPGQQGPPDQGGFQNSGHPPQYHPQRKIKPELRLNTYMNNLDNIFHSTNPNPALPSTNVSNVRTKPTQMNQGPGGSGHPLSNTNPRDVPHTPQRYAHKSGKDRPRELSPPARPVKPRNWVSKNRKEMQPGSKKAAETKTPFLDRLKESVDKGRKKTAETKGAFVDRLVCGVDDALQDQANKTVKARWAEDIDHSHPDNGNGGPHWDSRGRNV